MQLSIMKIKLKVRVVAKVSELNVEPRVMARKLFWLDSKLERLEKRLQGKKDKSSALIYGNRDNG